MSGAAREFLLEPDDPDRLAGLCGPLDANLRQIEHALGVQIGNRGSRFRVSGGTRAAERVEALLRELYGGPTGGPTAEDLALRLAEFGAGDEASGEGEVAIKVKRGTLRGRGPNQRAYLAAIHRHALNFGVGPAGTGKTYLAVASAVAALDEARVQRLILVRPAVEAGEKLGFLPGDLAQKVDPYLRPLYDALFEMVGVDRVQRLIERNVIEIAPLAYMRGRTLNEAFVILDEAQNTSIEQMKMFLTRIGFGSIAVVTGDLTQVDLPKSQPSGLRDALHVLRGVEGISVTLFSDRDVVRHPLVARIVRAYDAHEAGRP